MTNRHALALAGSAAFAAAFAQADIPLTNTPQGDTMYRGPQPASDQNIGDSGQVIGVHKKDAEGLLLIDAVTGRVLDAQEKPDWAEGHVVAMLAERAGFYNKRTGSAPAPSEVLAYEDLEWLALDTDTGDEKVIEADYEHRAEVLATILGVNRDPDAADNFGATLAADLEIARDDTRTDAEMKALTDAQADASFEEYERQSA